MRHFLILSVGWLISIVCACGAWADDGFGDSKRIDSEHFTIEYKNDVDMNMLLEGLKISATDEQLTHLRIDNASVERQLSSMVEILFNRAGDILDMHVYSLKGHIKVFANHEQLEAFYLQLSHGDHLPGTGLSFYSADDESIYIAATAFRREILGHEMGHAIMSRYFVVQPSIKIQEVLAGYVEYSLRKSK
jgi:hypothetical protein